MNLGQQSRQYAVMNEQKQYQKDDLLYLNSISSHQFNFNISNKEARLKEYSDYK